MAEPSPPHFHLRRFSGVPNDNWDQFEGLLRASIAVSSRPEAHHQRARYLHLHLDGDALNLYLRLPEVTKTTWTTLYKSNATAMQVQINEEISSFTYSHKNLTP